MAGDFGGNGFGALASASLILPMPKGWPAKDWLHPPSKSNPRCPADAGVDNDV